MVYQPVKQALATELCAWFMAYVSKPLAPTRRKVAPSCVVTNSPSFRCLHASIRAQKKKKPFLHASLLL